MQRLLNDSLVMSATVTEDSSVLRFLYIIRIIQLMTYDMDDICDSLVVYLYVTL